MYSKLKEKIDYSNQHQLYFSEFGTRRRFNYQVQHDVVKELSTNAHFCTGTSNVHLAMLYNMKPIGTVAHEWIMFHGANFGYKMANYKAFDAWTQVFDGSLGIALTDTYGSNAFFKNLSLKHAKLFDGLRQDSGDEKEFVEKAIHRYKELGVNPLLKTIVFSNALTFPKFKEIADYCKGKIGMCAAGIGTNLTNDVGCKPANIVMKLMACRMNSKQEWLDCIKISDDQGKAMGVQSEIEKCYDDLKIQP
jgi:nicotinate phosphoribosyltransferase